MCVCVCIYIYTHTHTYIYTCIYKKYICVCVHILMSIHSYTRMNKSTADGAVGRVGQELAQKLHTTQTTCYDVARHIILLDTPSYTSHHRTTSSYITSSYGVTWYAKITARSWTTVAKALPCDASRIASRTWCCTLLCRCVCVHMSHHHTVSNHQTMPHHQTAKTCMCSETWTSALHAHYVTSYYVTSSDIKGALT